MESAHVGRYDGEEMNRAAAQDTASSATSHVPANRWVIATCMILDVIAMIIFTRLTPGGSYATHVLPGLIPAGAINGLIGPMLAGSRQSWDAYLVDPVYVLGEHASTSGCRFQDGVARIGEPVRLLRDGTVVTGGQSWT
jgi:hypothetical protein